MFVKQIPNSLNLFEYVYFRLREELKLKFNTLPLIVHFAELGLELSLFCCDGTYFSDLIDIVHYTHVFQLL